MKYVIIIADGAADHPLDDLDGRTPLEVARKPNTDRLSLEGRQGTVATTPEGMACGSDVCSMSLLGYDPRKYHKGRAPLEAAAMGIELDPADWVFRVNLVTVIDGKMQDHSAGHISTQEGRRLLEDFAAGMQAPGMLLYPGVSYRNIMVDVSGRADGDSRSQDSEQPAPLLSANAQGARPSPQPSPQGRGGAAGTAGGGSGGTKGRDWSGLRTTPPHDIPGEAISAYLPTGGHEAALLREMIAQSEELFARHEINQARREAGALPATHVWPWGQGRKPVIPSFRERFKLRGAMITAVDLLAGIASFIGWDRLAVPGQTSYHDTDYAAAGRGVMAALPDYDLICVHIEAPDEASHAADAKTKVAAIEAIDQYVVGPVHEALAKNYGDGYRILYLPDHYTAVGTRKHDPTPPPFAICGTQVAGVLRRPFTEANAAASDLHVKYGHELMEYFLSSGLS